ncbi:MAG: FecR domain-containing protein [Opitutaceae bacterium]|nr:FecR domain-containing protein [Opitutaceae bacterium]
MSAPDRDSSNVRATEDALRWLRGARAETVLVAQVKRVVRARRLRRAAVLAGAAALAMGLWASFRPASEVRRLAGPTAIVTEPNRRILPDGSVVVLREGADIATEFSATVRRIALRHGEAHFEVVKDAARPFVVSAKGVDVRAVGTAFTVGWGGAGVEVLVTHGRVAVEPATHAAALVDAGQRARVPSTGTTTEIRVLSAAELAQAAAWRAPQIEFSQTPLAEALELINARLGSAGHRRISADPADERLRAMRLSGFLAADNAEGFLLLLETNFGVQADRSGPAAIVLRAKR